VKRIEVQLREDSGEIHLIVSDSGRGFDVEAAMKGKGLGLSSMRERVRLLNGTIKIDSKPMGGTSIHVRVPAGVGAHPPEGGSQVISKAAAQCSTSWP
jgi:signal transduction histidine kinase